VNYCIWNSEVKYEALWKERCVTWLKQRSVDYFLFDLTSKRMLCANRLQTWIY
jgi:hypothetical protein